MITHVALRPMSFEDLQPGQEFTAGPRTIPRADIDAFTALSGDRTALHSDDSYARTTPFGGVVAHGALILSVGTGLAYEIGIFEGTVLAVRSMEVSFDRPVFPGDSLTLRLNVTAKDGQPRSDRGRVTFALEMRNQHDRLVLTGSWVIVVRRTGAGQCQSESASKGPEPPV
jgi:acyl dehydratase